MRAYLRPSEAFQNESGRLAHFLQITTTLDDEIEPKGTSYAYEMIVRVTKNT
jgi:hypothetical protein